MHLMKNPDSKELAKALAYIKVEVATDEIRGMPMFRQNGGAWERLDEDAGYCIQDELARKCKIKPEGGGKPVKAYYTQHGWKRALKPLLHQNKIHAIKDWVLSYEDDASKMSVEEAHDILEECFSKALSVDIKDKRYAFGATVPWLGIVNRTLNPGEAHRVLLVLSSNQQHVGKSEFIEHLLPLRFRDEFYNPSVRLYGPLPKFCESIRNQVVGEVSEMVGSKSSDIEEFKARIGPGTDVYRTPWDKVAAPIKRTITLIATTNDNKPLPPDSSGYSRYIVVPVGNKTTDRQQPDFKSAGQIVDEHRDRCMAAALCLYRNGYGLRELPQDIAEAIMEGNKDAVNIDDTIASRIAKLVEKGWTGGLDLVDILVECGLMLPGQRPPHGRARTEYIEALKQAGATQEQYRIKGKKHTDWFTPAKDDQTVIRVVSRSSKKNIGGAMSLAAVAEGSEEPVISA